MQSVNNQQSERPLVTAWLRKLLWGDVLPEALGLCFVAIIFGGFASAYFIAERAWSQQARDAAGAAQQRVAATIGAGLGALAERDPDGAVRWLLEEAHRAGLDDVRWTDAEGTVQATWPPSVSDTPAAGPAGQLVATQPVIGTNGAALGTLRIASPAGRYADPAGHLLWNWGIAAGVTLLVFGALYQRLRHHLRPVGAIARSLHSYAQGIERELLTLRLSDSFGAVADEWNDLIQELNELQRQMREQATTPGGMTLEQRIEATVFRRVVDRLPFGVLCVGDESRIGYANAAAAVLLRTQPEALQANELANVIDNAAVAQACAGVRARGGGSQLVDHVSGTGDQQTMLRFRFVRLDEQSTQSEVLVTVEDVGQLREDQRARDNFLYHVTHELRTPLTNIHAYAETLTKPGFDDEQTRKECYNVITSETRRLSRLVEDILSISQLEVGTARLNAGEVDLLRLLRQTVQDNLGGADEKHIDLTLALPPKLPKMQGDKQRLAILLNNLIGNAVKYTPDNGKVQVKVELDTEALRIVVSDTGIGISPEDQAHVFDKFYRAADETVQMISGTGLGLALAREVARLHGGDIMLESTRGEGSTFTVELPLPHASHAPSPSSATTPEVPPR